MKTIIAILILTGILLTFCAPGTATQEREVTPEVTITEAQATQVPVATERPTLTEKPTLTEPPTVPATAPPLVCLSLLTPVNGADLPLTGKVTFSWTPMTGAGNYVLMFILPSGVMVSFETDELFRDRYMEAFEAGGTYQWQVTALKEDGSVLCDSGLFTFDKPAFEIAPTGEPD